MQKNKKQEVTDEDVRKKLLDTWLEGHSKKAQEFLLNLQNESCEGGRKFGRKELELLVDGIPSYVADHPDLGLVVVTGAPRP